jgi:hypothetical protein
VRTHKACIPCAHPTTHTQIQKQMNTANTTNITTLPQTHTIRKPRKTNAETLLHTHPQGSVTAGPCSSPTLGTLQQLLPRLSQSLTTEKCECGLKNKQNIVHKSQPSRNQKLTNTAIITEMTYTFPETHNNTQNTNTATHSPSRLTDGTSLHIRLLSTSALSVFALRDARRAP